MIRNSDQLVTLTLKNGEQYILVMDRNDRSLAKAQCALWSWASNPELSFSYFDMALGSTKLLELFKEKCDVR